MSTEEIPDLAPTGSHASAADIGQAKKGKGARKPRLPEPPPSPSDKAWSIPFDLIIGHPLHAVTSPRAYPWSAIVLLKIRFQSGATGHGTGWFFAPSRIATAAHNLLHPHEGAAVGMDILAGWDGARAAEQFSIAAKHIAPGWRPPWNEANDWAVIATDHAPATQLGHFGFQAYDQGYPAGLQLYVSGYPGDEYGVIPLGGVAGSGNQCWDNGQLASVTPAELNYTISTAPGMSGAPVFLWHNNGAIAVGIHTQGKGATNAARRIDGALQATLSNFWG